MARAGRENAKAIEHILKGEVSEKMKFDQVKVFGTKRLKDLAARKLILLCPGTTYSRPSFNAGVTFLWKER